jgi:hypothetical protein
MSEAASALGVATSTYTDPTPPPAPAPNSPEAAAQATEWLARKSAELRGAANDDPAVRMSKMLNDPDFMRRIQGGNAEAQREWNEAMAAAVVQANVPETERLGRQHLAEMGYTGKQVEEIMSDQPSSPQDVAFARAKKALAFDDSAWLERYMRGGLVEKGELNIWDAVIAKAPEG